MAFVKANKNNSETEKNGGFVRTTSGGSFVKAATSGTATKNNGRENGETKVANGKTYDAVKSQYDADKFGKGNIDLTARPIYKNADGKISTVNSMSINEDGKEVLIPTIVNDKNGNAKMLTEREAIEHYHNTGEFLGKFDTVDEANEYANALHIDQDIYYSNLYYGSEENRENEVNDVGNTRQQPLTAEDYKNFSAYFKKQLAESLPKNKGDFDGKKVRELTKQYAAVQAAIYENNLKNGFTGTTPIGDNIANLYKAHGYDFQKLFPDLYDAYSTGNVEAFAYQNSGEYKVKVDDKRKAEIDKVLFDLGKTFDEQIKTAEDELAVLEEKQYAMGGKTLAHNPFIRPTANYSVEDITKWKNEGVDFGEEIASKKAEIESIKAYYTSVSEVFRAKSQPDFEEKSKYVLGITQDKGESTNSYLPKGFYEKVAREHNKDKKDLTFSNEDGSTYTVTVDKNGLTDDEYGTLMYILNTQGAEAADKFYEGIAFNRNSNIAQSVHDTFQETEKGGLFQKIGAGIGETAYALASGVEGLITAPINMVADMTGVGSGYYAPSVSQQVTAKNIESADGLGRIGLQAVQTAPQIAGVVAAAKFGGPTAANAFLAYTAFPSSYVDARNRGASEAQALNKAGLDTALELATEKFLGNTIEGSGTTFTGLVGSAVKKTGIGAKVFDFFSDVASKYPNIGTSLRLVGKSSGSGISEMAEEYTASFFAPYVENIVYGTTKKAELWNEEEKESSAVGFITGLILGEARNVNLYSYIANGDYGARIAEIYSLSDKAVTADYLKNIDVSTLTEIARYENEGFDSLTEQEQSEMVARVRSRIESGITPEEARAELLEEETLRAAIFGMEDLAKQGYAYEEASNKLRKQGVDVNKYSEFAKQAYEIGEQKKPLMPEIPPVAVEMAREGKSSSEIADTLVSAGKESSVERAIRAANAAKNKVFSETLMPEMTVVQRQKAMQDRIIAENKAEEEYFAEKYNNTMSEAKETLGNGFNYAFISDAVNKISSNLLKSFAEENGTHISAGRVKNIVLEAIVARGEVSKENITKQLADAFAMSMPVASKTYQTLVSPGTSATEALTNYALRGEISNTVADKASLEEAGKRFKAISDSAATQVANARKHLYGTSALETVTVPAVTNTEYITAEMTDAERYEILKDKKITLAKANAELYNKYYEQMPQLLEDKLKTKDAKKLIKKIATDFGVFTEYENKDFDIKFEFGRNNLDESIGKQKGNYDLYAQMLSCFSDVISNAVGIEVHNRNNDGYKVDMTLKNVYVLCSAFENDTDIVPVKLSVKEFVDKENRLYVAVALESIKKDRVVSMGVQDNLTHVRTSPAIISIRDIFRNVNPLDVDFLKYIPDDFLNEEQIAAKNGVNSDLKKAPESDTMISEVENTSSETENKEDIRTRFNELTNKLSKKYGEGAVKEVLIFSADVADGAASDVSDIAGKRISGKKLLPSCIEAMAADNDADAAAAISESFSDIFVSANISVEMVRGVIDEASERIVSKRAELEEKNGVPSVGEGNVEAETAEKAAESVQNVSENSSDSEFDEWKPEAKTDKRTKFGEKAKPEDTVSTVFDFGDGIDADALAVFEKDKHSQKEINNDVNTTKNKEQNRNFVESEEIGKDNNTGERFGVLQASETGIELRDRNTGSLDTEADRRTADISGNRDAEVGDIKDTKNETGRLLRRTEDRSLEEICESENFVNLSRFIGDEISSAQSKAFIDAYINGEHGESEFDLMQLVAYDVVSDENNNLREIFSDNVDEYFLYDSLDSTQDITGKAVPDDVRERFKNTVVKSSKGSLIPVYHGTDKYYPNLKRGETGIHFGSYAQAANRAKDKGFDTPYFVKAYLNITNPVIIEDDFFNWNAPQLAHALSRTGVITADEAVKYFESAKLESIEKANEDIVQKLKELGYDGIIYQNAVEAVNGKSYIVFDESQIFRLDGDDNSTNKENTENGREQTGIPGTESEGHTGGNVSALKTDPRQGTENSELLSSKNGIVTLKKPKGYESAFKKSERIIVGKEHITNGFVGIRKSLVDTEKVKTYANKKWSNVSENNEFDLTKHFTEGANLMITGDPKVIEVPRVARAYSFKIDGGYYIYNQQFVDAFAKDGNTFWVNPEKPNSAMGIKNADGESIGLIMPIRSSSKNDASLAEQTAKRHNEAKYASEVLEEKRQEKASKKETAEFSYSLDDSESDLTQRHFSPSEKVVQAFADSIDKWLSGNMKSNEYFELGEPPTVLKELGAKDLPVIMSQDVIVKITGEKHSISLDEIKRLPEAIHDPIMVFSSATVPNAFVLITELTDKSGNDVVVALHLNKKQDRLSVNRIASVYGKGNVANFVEAQSELGNLRYVDKEKSQQWSTSRGLQLPKLVQSITDNDSILQKEDIVNSILFENGEKDSGNIQKNVAETDNEYLEAVESGDVEKAQRMVDEAARTAGYNSPLLYHGTSAFGFTEFDLSKADDGRTIFLTSSEEIASTYSGVDGKRKVSDIYTEKVENMSVPELANALNEVTEKYGASEDGDKNRYSYYDYGKVNRLISQVNTGLEELRPTIDGKISEYAERMSEDFNDKDAKVHKQLVELKEKLDKWEYDKLSTPIYMLLHHTDVFSGSANVKKVAELEKNIRIMNRVRSSKSLDEGVIVSESLGGYYTNTLSRDVAIRQLRSLISKGNYSLYAKLVKPLTIDAHGELWNSIYGWSDDMVPKADSVEVTKEGNEYRLKDKETGKFVEDAVIDVNDVTSSMTDEERKTFILNKIRDMWSIRTENIKSTRGIAKYAKEHGYGSVIIKNLVDNGGNNSRVDMDTKADIYILFDSNNAKSADPVTYDDDGNVIPLSERFNPEKNDIRYSIEGQTSIYENESEAEHERNSIYDGSERRNAGESSGKQDERLVEGTGETSEVSAEERRRYSEALTDEQIEKKTFKDSSGRAVKADLIKKSAWNDDMRSLAEAYANKGIEVAFTKGSIKLGFAFGRTARAMHMNGRLVISYDNALYSPQTLAKHEYVHEVFDSTEVRKAVENIRSTMSDSEYQSAIMAYKAKYRGITSNEADLQQELYCDILAGIYENYAVFQDVINSFWTNDLGGVDRFKVSEYDNTMDAGGKTIVSASKEANGNGQSEGTNLLLERSGWRGSSSSEEQKENLFGRSGTNHERMFEERKRTAKEIKSKSGYVHKVAEDTHLYLIKESSFNEEMSDIVKFVNDYGHTCNILLIDAYDDEGDHGPAFIGYDDEIYVSYTNQYSPWKLARHEIVHTVYNTKEFEPFKRGIRNRFTEEMFGMALAEPRYALALKTYLKDEDALFQEIVCDIFAGAAPENLSEGFDDLIRLFWNSNVGKTKRNTKWFNELLNDENFRFSLDDDGNYDFGDIWRELVDEYGAIPTGEKPARDIDVPKKIDERRVVSRFARTMMEAGVTSDHVMSEFEERILDGTMTHLVITNEAARSSAQKQIEYEGFKGALTKWNNLVDEDVVGKKQLVFGMELYNQCITNGDVASAMKIAADLTAMATSAGQTLQACRVLKLMSPDGQLYYLEKSVDKMNKEFRKKIGKKFKDIELDENLMKEFLQARDEEAKNEAYDKICQSIADQIPSTFRDKWDSWRYLAMLGNPRTHIKNFVGNAVFVPAIRIKNMVGAIGERAFRVNKEERTRSFYKTGESKDFAKADFEKMKKTLQGENSKYATTSDIESRRTIFKSKLLETLRRKNFDFLEAEDMAFLKLHYVDALARVITARGIDVNNVDPETLDKIRLFAVRQAQEATYRDANALAEELNRIERAMKTSDKKAVRAASVLVEGVMPFKKTPLNIAKQGILYSPVSILTGISKTVKVVKRNGDVSVTEAIDDLAKGLTGTGLMLLGYFLARHDLLSGPDDEDEKKSRFDEMVGEQSYSFNVGGHSYTIDWMTPSSMPLFVGCELFNLTKDKFTFSDITAALSSMTDPVFELSVLSGISNLFNGVMYGEGSAAFNAVWDMTTSYFTQALPTIGGQVSRLLDDNKREYYYTDKNSQLPSSLQRLIGQVSSKIPFVSYLFEPSIDDWGREESYGGIVERTLENVVSPGYYSKEAYTRVDDELAKLYRKTGDNSVFPTKVQKYYVSDGVYYHMNAEDYTEVKKRRGKLSFKLVKELIGSSNYKAMSDEEKIKAISKCYREAGETVKGEMLEKIKRHSK